MPGPQILGILTTFPIEKVNFGHFAYQGSVKMPFWPYFDPILSPPEPKPLALAKMCLFRPTARRDLGGTLGDPKFDPILTILDPFWGSWSEAAARPRTSCLWAGASQTHARDLKFWSFWPLLTSCENLENDLILDHFGPQTHDLSICSVQIGPFWRLTLRNCPFWPILVILDPILSPGFKLWRLPLTGCLCHVDTLSNYKVLVKCVKVKYFWYGTFRFTVVSMGFAKVFHLWLFCEYLQILPSVVLLCF